MSKEIEKAKWKTGLQYVLVALVIIGIISSVMKFATYEYYHGGNPPRWNILGDVITTSYAVTSPNLVVRREQFSTKPCFAAQWEGYFEKLIGYRYYRVGEIGVPFQFSNTEYPKVSWFDKKSISTTFIYPDPARDFNSEQDWEALKILPEGTVAEAYISFAELLETDEALQKFEDNEIIPIWFAVDTGLDNSDDFQGYPIGFPYDVVGVLGDHTLKSLTHRGAYPESYGNGDRRNQDFIDMLYTLKEHEELADQAAAAMWVHLNLDKRIAYLEENGVKVFGVAVTGPTKEILELQKEDWISHLKVGEVRLWNKY